MQRSLILGFGTLLLAACASAGGARSTDDSRVRSFMGQAPPEVAGGARWLNAQPTTLAALRGHVVYVQFAFPT